jgi:hypothetical protein
MSIFGLDHLSPTPPSPTAKAVRDAGTRGSSVIPATAAAPFWWLGVHGGAGESSLAALFPGFPAAEHQWPVHRSARTRVVLVARTNHRGMSAVQAAMRDWSASYRGHTDVLGLVLMADRPGKLPRPLRDLLRDLGGATPNLWRLPWIENWTVGEVPSLANAPTKEVEALRVGVTAAIRAAGRDRHDG